MHTAIGGHHNMNRKALRPHELNGQMEKKNMTNAYTLATLENSYADAPLARPVKLFSRTESSSASVFTTADSTYYSRPSSQPSTPTSTVPSDRGKRDSDNATAPAPSRPESFAPSSIYGHDTEDWEFRKDTQAQEPLPELEAPSKIHLRLKQERPPTRDFLFFTPKPSSSKHDKEEHDPEDSKAQVAAIAKGSDSVEAEQTRRNDHPDSMKAHGYTESTPLTFPSTQLPLKERKVDIDGSLKARARRKILAHKHSMQIFQVTLNGFCIFSTWWWPRYYYILLPLITATVAINVAMVASLIIRAVWNKITPEKIIRPETPESMIFLIPCYNETKEELTRSLESLVAQQKIDDHKKAIMIVCDGKVRGPGMEKSTGDYLLQNILTNKVERKYIKGAYTAWDQQPMDIVVQRGKYQGVPYYCIIKQQNQGKRDGLIVVRSFLYNFNRRMEKPNTVFAPEFFNDMCSFLINDGGLDNCVHLIGMDADTVFDDDCIYHLLEESRYAHTVGVCGYVAVDWKDSNWNLWRLYQSAEYTIAQCLRRLHQSMVTHKVSCLPGCCQLLRICEETCGDHVLLELFGYCPVQTDGLLKQIRATASEDRNHVCHMLTARPKAQTRQALKAKAYTDVPQSWSVFLSQRRRWTLGATSNDLLLAFARGVQWFERILALVNVVTWILNPFIIASLASFIFAILTVQVWIIMCFVGVMLIPIVYYIIIPIWLTKSWTSRIQFWTGLFMYVFMGPFLNIAVLLYASFYMDSFGWGKTRKVISDEEGASNCENELQRLEKGETSRPSGGSSTCVEGSSQGSVEVSPGAAAQQSRDCADEEKNIAR